MFSGCNVKTHFGETTDVTKKGSSKRSVMTLIVQQRREKRQTIEGKRHKSMLP